LFARGQRSSSAVPQLQHLRPILERAQRDLLLAVDVEQRVQPGEFEQVRHSLAEPGKFHLASALPDDAVASHQFAHAVAVECDVFGKSLAHLQTAGSIAVKLASFDISTLCVSNGLTFEMGLC
jgi:hypothetical protein